MKTTVIAISDQQCPTFNMLPPSFVRSLDHTLLFHRTPHIEYNDDNFVNNFNYHIDFGSKHDMMNRNGFPDKYIHQPRHIRTRQMFEVCAFNDSNKFRTKLHYPKHFTASFGENVDASSQAYVGIPSNIDLVIKGELSARGEGQVVVPSRLLSTFLPAAAGLTASEIKERFPTLLYSPSKSEDAVMFNTPSDIMVCELLTDIVKEWRVLVSGDKLWARERVINNNAYPQATLDHKSVDPVTYVAAEDCLGDVAMKHIQAFAKHINMMFGSIDLYATTDGHLGIFEYSNEYGVHGTEPDFIRGLCVDAVLYMIKDK